MTNAEAAKHFASLPADEQAKIVILNADTLTADVHYPEPTTSEVLEPYGEEGEGLEHIPHILIKW